MKYIDISKYSNVYRDGVSDDTKALQDCLDEIKDGGTIYFPKGTYLLSAALIFYSNQRLVFDDEAVILRSVKSDVITRYLLASYSEPDWAGYEGTHDVEIVGGLFDGNAQCNESITMINTVHCRNITIKNSRFVHGSNWHCIEINGSENVLITGCVFDGNSYTGLRDNLLNELVQIDLPLEGAYGPVYAVGCKLIDFCRDGIGCINIVFENNVFRCYQAPGFGYHGKSDHHDIVIRHNTFIGTSGVKDFSRGYVIFLEDAYNITVEENVFISTCDGTEANKKIVLQKEDLSTYTIRDNEFYGYFSE